MPPKAPSRLERLRDTTRVLISRRSTSRAICLPVAPVAPMAPKMTAYGVHAVVVASILVNVEMFRYGKTYQLLITRRTSL